MNARGRWLDDDLTYIADLSGRQVRATVVRGHDAIEVRICGKATRLLLQAPSSTAAVSAGDGRMLAPMPGRVLALDVAVGQSVAVGDRLLVLEAMKMEHRIVARRSGTIRMIHAAEGEQVSDGALLVEIND